jgi:hypothetical protein
MKERLAAAGGYRGSSLHKAGESGEDSTDFTGMFEPVIIAFSVAVVAHHIGQTERAQYVAHARHASADRAGDFAGVKLLVLRKQFDAGECDRIAEQAAQARLPVAVLFHAASLSRFRNSENVKRNGRWAKRLAESGQDHTVKSLAFNGGTISRGRPIDELPCFRNSCNHKFQSPGRGSGPEIF